MCGVSVCARKPLKRARRFRSWQKRKLRQKRRALERYAIYRESRTVHRDTMTDPVMHQLRRQINRTASVGQAPPVRGGLIVLAGIVGIPPGLPFLCIWPKFRSALGGLRVVPQAGTNLKTGNFYAADATPR